MPRILQALRRPLSHHTSAYHPPCCFLLLRQNIVSAKVNAPIDYTTEIFPYFIGLHETTIFRVWKAQNNQKRACAQPLSFSHYLFTVLLIYHLAKPPILFGKTLYNLAKLPAFAKLYRVLPDCMRVLPKGFTFAKSYEVLPKGFTFAKLYPAFAKRFILFGKRTPEQKFALFRM